MILNGRFLSRSVRLLLANSILCSFICASPAQESKLSPEKRTQMEAAVADFMASTHVPGLSVAVIENGEYEWGSASGWQMQNNNALPANTLFFAWVRSLSR